MGSCPDGIRVVSKVVWQGPSEERERVGGEYVRKWVGLGEFRYVVGGGDYFI